MTQPSCEAVTDMSEWHRLVKNYPALRRVLDDSMQRVSPAESRSFDGSQNGAIHLTETSDDTLRFQTDDGTLIVGNRRNITPLILTSVKLPKGNRLVVCGDVEVPGSLDSHLGSNFVVLGQLTASNSNINGTVDVQDFLRSGQGSVFDGDGTVSAGVGMDLTWRMKLNPTKCHHFKVLRKRPQSGKKPFTFHRNKTGVTMTGTKVSGNMKRSSGESPLTTAVDIDTLGYNSDSEKQNEDSSTIGNIEQQPSSSGSLESRFQSHYARSDPSLYDGPYGSNFATLPYSRPGRAFCSRLPHLLYGQPTSTQNTNVHPRGRSAQHDPTLSSRTWPS